MWVQHQLALLIKLLSLKLSGWKWLWLQPRALAGIARGTLALLCAGLARRPWGDLPDNCSLCRSWLIISPLFVSMGVRREVINKMINSLSLSPSHRTVKVCFNWFSVYL